MTKLLPGTVVKINNLKKSSWYLYKKYLSISPLLICPCHCKNRILIVREVFDNGIVLLQVKNNSRLTMTYFNDLEAIYEPNT
jgi:hypothetical protein